VLAGVSGDRPASFGSDVAGVLTGTNSGVDVLLAAEFGL